MKCLMDLSTKEEIFYNLAQKVAPTAINQMLTTTKYYSKAIVLAADLSLESHLKTSMTALILRGARQQPISTKKFKEDKFRCGLLLRKNGSSIKVDLVDSVDLVDLVDFFK